MAKRSPILGYNHNVRYRGLVFHVQTEDSGVLSPHLFTHLFYEGVIVSTRKLVYDAGASEDAIKALMQAQHKAVLKDLKQHAFDEKIDQYLGGTPGLEPRERAATPPLAEQPRASEPEIQIDASERPGKAPTETPVEAAAPRARRKSAAPPAKAAPEPVAKAPEPVIEERPPRTKTAERTSRASQFRSMPPPPAPEDAAPTLSGADAAAVAAEMHAQQAATVPTPAPVMRPTTPPPAIPARPTPPRAATPPPIPASARRPHVPMSADSSPEIEIIQHDETSARNRSARDTAVDNRYDDAVPRTITPDATVPSDGIPGRISAGVDSAPVGRSSTPSRPPSHGAATLPAVRPPSRPQITPAQVVSRPLPPEQRNHDNTDAIEVYAPAPASVEPPPGERSERPGQYSMKRGARDQDVPLRDHTGRAAIPAGLGRPRAPQVPAPRTAASSSPPIIPEQMRGVPQPVRPETAPGSGRLPSSSDGVPRAKAPSEQSRPPNVTAPMASRTGTGGNSNVVMTRPAVIVGAPPKTPGAPPRVRKAREDEGRGFGQGLISEKSLDEVILAYLSEDAEEK